MPKIHSKATGTKVNPDEQDPISRRNKPALERDENPNPIGIDQRLGDDGGVRGSYLFYSLILRLIDLYLRHRPEAESQLSREGTKAKQEYRKERSLIRIFLLVAVVLCVVWVIVFLSGRFSSEDKDLITGLFEKLVFVLVGLLAGRGIKPS
jgi:hypothetical protein